MDMAQKTVAEAGSKLINKVQNIAEDKAKLIKLGVYFVSIMLIILLFVWSYTKFSLKDTNCAKIEKSKGLVEGNFDNIVDLVDDPDKCRQMNDGHQSTAEIDDRKTTGEYKLRDFVVKTAYNCCATGGFSHDYVDICALENCIETRARCLDFEIYSFNNKPVIALSTINRHNIKESYNALDFGSVMQRIKDTAFINTHDPLFLHFRIKTKNIAILNQMAVSIFDNFSDRLLPSQYSYEYNHQSMGDVEMSKLYKKIIIMVSKINDNNTCSFDEELSNVSVIPIEDSKLYEYVNIITGSNNMNVHRYSNAKVGVDRLAVMEHNKTSLGMVIPDCDNNPSNYDWVPLAFKNDENETGDYTQFSYGFQFIGLSFQDMDKFLVTYHDMFNKKKSSFILKPELLRAMDTVVTVDTARVDNTVSEVKDSTNELLGPPWGAG